MFCTLTKEQGNMEIAPFHSPSITSIDICSGPMESGDSWLFSAGKRGWLAPYPRAYKA